ncbi:MAG: riboflavin synthase [candidate division Zixibacteria bacterium]|nr:riboflavin synthase [candidate division Zixibacteria bacterium]
MFTGIVETMGIIRSVRPDRGGFVFSIEERTFASETREGASIAVDGVCLTVVSRGQDLFTVEVVPETVRRTTFKHRRVGDRVNLERAMRLSDRIEGHLVQGHVDGVGRIAGREVRGNSLWYTIEIPEVLTPYLIEKGSIAIDGISLTIALLTGNLSAVAIIPHTASVTTLGDRKVGDEVNIETDIIGRYVESLLRAGRLPGPGTPSITEAWLKEKL